MTDFLGGRVVLHHGDCREVLVGLADASIDSVVTDPPYALVSIGKRFGADGAKAANGGPYRRLAAGFMGQRWDTGEVAFDPAFWADVLRVLKPGGHVLAMGGTRTYHRLVCAIEDGGFEIRDAVAWLYGSGFPKSHNGAWGGSALKPALELVCLARKPLIGTIAENHLAHGVGGLNIDGCRVDSVVFDSERRTSVPSPGIWGKGTQQHPQIEGEQRHNTAGRWPANVAHDGSAEVQAAFPEAPGQQRGVGPEFGNKDGVNCYGDYGPRQAFEPRGDSGTAARFFYTAKADADGRAGSAHPTVKPVDLMRWLVRLVTPIGGVVLDPFAGSGTTGEAAFLEGMRAVLIEREDGYCADIGRRLGLLGEGPEMRALRLAAVREERRPTPWDEGTLFA